MKLRPYLTIFILLILAGPLCFHEYLAADPLESPSGLQNEIYLPATAPEKDRFTLVSMSPVVVKGETLGIGAVYDDPATRRCADYLELYDWAGHLLVISWFDKFGIERIAIDRGLLKDAGMLEGVFVVVLDGVSL